MSSGVPQSRASESRAPVSALLRYATLRGIAALGSSQAAPMAQAMPNEPNYGDVTLEISHWHHAGAQTHSSAPSGAVATPPAHVGTTIASSKSAAIVVGVTTAPEHDERPPETRPHPQPPKPPSAPRLENGNAPADSNIVDDSEDDDAPKRHYALRDPLAALALVLALAYLAYLTYVGERAGHTEYVYTLARALVSRNTRRAVFEFPLVRLAVTRIGGPLALLSGALALPLAFATLIVVRVAGRFVIVGACVGALVLALLGTLRFAISFFATGDIFLAMLFLTLAFVCVVLFYLLYLSGASFMSLGTLFEQASEIVLCAMPALTISTAIVGALYGAFLLWWCGTVAALLTTSVSVMSARAAMAAGLLEAPGSSLGSGSSVAEAAGSVALVGGAEFSVYFCVILLVWISNIANGLLRVSIAGGANAWQHGRSVNAGVLAGLARALTFSLGSIAIATFFVTIVEFAHMLLSRIKTLQKRTGLGCFVSATKLALLVLRQVLRYINSFVFVEFALSGSSFMESSKLVYARFARGPAKAFFSYSASSYVLVALRTVIAFSSVALAAALRLAFGSNTTLSIDAWLTLVGARGTAAAYGVAYFVATLPTAWLESAAHARLVCEVDRERAEEKRPK